MQSLPAHERRAPIEARWARLGPRVEAALALNCDALTRACLIDSIVRGGVRDGVNLSNEGLLEVYLARQSSGVRARGLSGCLPRVVQAHATTLHVLLSRQPQRTLAAADAAFREARSSDSRARIPREKAVANPIYLPLRARRFLESQKSSCGASARSCAETRPRLSRSSSTPWSRRGARAPVCGWARTKVRVMLSSS